MPSRTSAAKPVRLLRCGSGRRERASAVTRRYPVTPRTAPTESQNIRRIRRTPRYAGQSALPAAAPPRGWAGDLGRGGGAEASAGRGGGAEASPGQDGGIQASLARG